MAIGVAYIFVKNAVDSEARNQKRDPQAGSARDEIFRIELTATFSYFNHQIMTPSCQSSATVKFMKSRK